MLWSRLAGLQQQANEAADWFAPEAELRLERLRLTMGTGELGPWRLALAAKPERIDLELAPSAEGAERPLDLRGTIPRGATGLWSFEMRAGPSSLADIGLGEGALGFSQVADSRVELRGSVQLEPAAKTMVADLKLLFDRVTFAHPAIAEEPLRDMHAMLSGVLSSEGDLRSFSLRAGAIEVGKLRLELDGEFALPDGEGHASMLKLAWRIPTVPCSDAVSSMPKALLPQFETLAVSGDFAARGQVRFDARVPDKTYVDLDLKQGCRILHVPPRFSVERFKQPFDLRVYGPKGEQHTKRFGPGTPEWVPYDRISPYVVESVLTCEDSGFFTHQGFSAWALRNAIVDDLKQARFARGGSTVTMQLAKNAFLDRRKLLSRKLAEFVLAAWLEQSLSKEEILETYLNVIEFGPNLYGIGPAAQHYFGRPAEELDPAEAMFLISLLPSPVKRSAMYELGAVPDHYSRYIHTLLRLAHDRGRLDDDEYAAASGHKLTFHRPGDAPPAPRVLLRGGADARRDPPDDAAAGPSVPPIE